MEAFDIGLKDYTFRVKVNRDNDMGPPWEEEDGHGPVSEWTRRPKRPGELILVEDHVGHRRYYDFAEACKIARREGWDSPPYNSITHPQPPHYRSAKAAKADFENLRKWCRNEWYWVYIEVVLLDDEGEETDQSQFRGGLTSDDEPDIRMEAENLAQQIVDNEGKTWKWGTKRTPVQL